MRYILCILWSVHVVGLVAIWTWACGNIDVGLVVA